MGWRGPVDADAPHVPGNLVPVFVLCFLEYLANTTKMLPHFAASKHQSPCVFLSASARVRRRSESPASPKIGIRAVTGIGGHVNVLSSGAQRELAIAATATQSLAIPCTTPPTPSRRGRHRAHQGGRWRLCPVPDAHAHRLPGVGVADAREHAGARDLACRRAGGRLRH